MTTSQPQYPAAAVAAAAGLGADRDGDEQLPVFPDEQGGRDASTDSDGEPVGLADRDEDVRRAGGDPDTI
jgi:hypothetical protein